MLKIIGSLEPEIQELAAPSKYAAREVPAQPTQTAVQNQEVSEKHLNAVPGSVVDKLMDSVKQQAQTALDHIESLQLLAKQTPAANGEQQLVVLPMKLDGAWTDVVIKMIKNNKGKSAKNKSKSISVDINVAPSLLGEISARMDYKSSRDFAVRMKFEKVQTMSWFEKNKETFIESFKKIGFVAPRIDLRVELSALKQPPDVMTAIHKTGILDVIA
jgi:hypothetical protein